MNSSVQKVNWRNSPWLVVVGFPLLALFVFGLLLPLRHPDHALVRACRSNLHQFVGAKQEWAEKEHKAASDIPTDDNLFGPDKYLREKLTCPAGGTYTLGAVSEKPHCSIPGHTI